MRWPRPTIRLRLTAWYAGIFLLMGAVLLAVSYAVVRENFDQAAAKRHVELESTLKRPGAASPRTVVRVRPGLPEETAPQIRRLSPTERSAYARAREALVEADDRANAQAKRRVLLEFLGALLALTIASVAAGYAVAGRVLRPIAKITGIAQRISDRTLSERIALDGPRDELRELADTFDGMLARLDRAFHAQRRFVANASHELRTPLAITRTEIDVTLADPDAHAVELREMAHVVREANERMARLIDALLALASSGAGALDAEPADLAAAARTALERTPGLEASGLHLDAVLFEAMVLGDPVLLERVACNLVENALRYNVAGGWIRVGTHVDGGGAELVVANSGPVVAEALVAELFEPFPRLEDSRTRATGGNGLGLAVVSALAEAHGGVAAATAPPDGGLEVRVTLPLRVATPLPDPAFARDPANRPILH
jgi:signal transduction histidine kinase